MSENPKAGEAAELRLAAESIKALAARLAELLAAPRPQRPVPPRRLLSAAEVSEWWGVGRRWVYEHAERLGVRRLGSGARPRLRFDPDEVAERLGVPRRSPPRPPDGRRLPSIDGNPHSDSLSGRRRATVGEADIQAAGRRANAPGPAPKGGLRRDSEPSRAGPSRRPFTAGESGGDR